MNQLRTTPGPCWNWWRAVDEIYGPKPRGLRADLGPWGCHTFGSHFWRPLNPPENGLPLGQFPGEDRITWWVPSLSSWPRPANHIPKHAVGQNHQVASKTGRSDTIQMTINDLVSCLLVPQSLIHTQMGVWKWGIPIKLPELNGKNVAKLPDEILGFWCTLFSDSSFAGTPNLLQGSCHGGCLRSGIQWWFAGIINLWVTAPAQAGMGLALLSVYLSIWLSICSNLFQSIPIYPSLFQSIPIFIFQSKYSTYSNLQSIPFLFYFYFISSSIQFHFLFLFDSYSYSIRFWFWFDFILWNSNSNSNSNSNLFSSLLFSSRLILF